MAKSALDSVCGALSGPKGMKELVTNGPRSGNGTMSDEGMLVALEFAESKSPLKLYDPTKMIGPAAIATSASIENTLICSRETSPIRERRTPIIRPCQNCTIFCPLCRYE